MRATSAYIRLFIRGLDWDSQEAGVPFSDTLKTAARARLTETSKGKVLTGTAANGTSVTYTLPEDDGAIAANDIAQVCSQLLDEVDAIRAATPAISEEALVIALLALHPSIPARAVGVNFSGLRL